MTRIGGRVLRSSGLRWSVPFAGKKPGLLSCPQNVPLEQFGLQAQESCYGQPKRAKYIFNKVERESGERVFSQSKTCFSEAPRRFTKSEFVICLASINCLRFRSILGNNPTAPTTPFK